MVKIFANYTAVIIFGLFITYERKLNVSEIYSLLIMFSSVEEPMSQFFNGWVYNIEGEVPLNKLSDLFKIEKYESSVEKGDLDLGEIKIEEGSFSWDDIKYLNIMNSFNNVSKGSTDNQENRISLNKINVHLKSKKFYAVVG